MHKYIKHILFFLSLFILHFSFGNNLASLSSIEGINVWGIEFSEKPNSDFSELPFKGNYIFENSYHDIVTFPSISFCDGYAELVEVWEVLHKSGVSDAVRKNTQLLENINYVSKSSPH